MGKPVYLGRIKLKWCPECNVPLAGKKCSLCGSEGVDVKITPPGEVKVGFKGDIDILNSAVERQFGCRIDRNIILFNRVPHRDRMEEVIISGKVIGSLRFDPDSRKHKLVLRLEGAYYLNKCARKGWVVADEGAVKPILSGKNLMVPGVKEVSEGLEKGDDVIIRDPDGRPFAVGIAKMNSQEMKNSKRGIAVKIRYSGYGNFEVGKDPPVEDMVKANIEHLRIIEREAVEFIKRTWKEHNLPMGVSFSGGKDSMATLLLAIESGVEFKTFFLNTGIELPETVEHVKEVEKKYGISIDRISADDAFWKALPVFGPPGRDYRWCCKVCKLGPTTRYILEHYPSGLLTLVGQRRYESEERMKKGRVWKNEWVPNQLSASPIQNWSSLEVWLYLLWKNAPINIWYKRGLTRIGCYLCPSSDLADFEVIKMHSNILEKWEDYLRNFANEHNIPEEWADSAWRWKRPPKWAGKWQVERRAPEVRFTGEGWKTLHVESDEIERIKNMLYALPEGSWRDGENIEVVEDYIKPARSLVIRAVRCVGCGVCVGRCPTNALYIDEENKIRIREDLCIHCLDCLGTCPAENF